MGCGVSRPETDEGGGEEGGDFKMITRKGSIGKDSEIADSYISDKELLETSTHSRRSKTGGENSSKEEEDECRNEEEKGDEIKISPESPSFRIYCVIPRDHHDDNIVDDHPQNNHTSDENKESKGRRQEAVGTRIRRRFNNVKKLLIPPSPTIPSSSAS